MAPAIKRNSNQHYSSVIDDYRLPMINLYSVRSTNSYGESMGTIRCPKCDEKLQGNNERELSAEFRDHLSSAHKMNAPKPGYHKGELAYGTEPSIVGAQVEGTYGAEIHGKKHLEERRKKGTLGTSENVEMRCPFCGALVIGSDEDEITDLVKGHFASKHE